MASATSSQELNLGFLIPQDHLSTQLDSFKAFGLAAIAGYCSLWHPSRLIQGVGRPRILSIEPDSAPTQISAEHSAKWLVGTIPNWLAGFSPDWRAWFETQSHFVVENLNEATPFRCWQEQTKSSVLSVPPLPESTQGLLDDFVSLGFCTLALELLFPQMESENKLTSDVLSTDLAAAAHSALNGVLDEATAHLRACFEALQNIRQMVYPGTIHWIDLTLCPPQADWFTRLGSNLRVLWSRRARSNFLISGNAIAALQQAPDEWMAEYRSALQNKTIEIVGGSFDDRPWTVLTEDSRFWQLTTSIKIQKAVLGLNLETFASRSSALTPNLPNLLQKCQLRSVFHAAFDGSIHPHFRKPKIRWSTPQGSSVDALVRTARSVTPPAQVVAVLQQWIDGVLQDRDPTIVLAHWLGDDSWWYQCLIRQFEFAPVLGTYQTITDFCRHSGYADRSTLTSLDEYDVPVLAELCRRNLSNPISNWQVLWRQRGRWGAIQSLSALSQLIAGTKVKPNTLLEDTIERVSAQWYLSSKLAPPILPQSHEPQQLEPGTQTVSEMAVATSPAGSQPLAVPETVAGCEQALDDWQTEVLQHLAATLFGLSESEATLLEIPKTEAEPLVPEKKWLETTNPSTLQEDGGFYLFNPCSFARRANVELPVSATSVQLQAPIRTVQPVESERSVVQVDMPGWGFVWVGVKEGAATSTTAEERLLAIAQKNHLQNEYVDLLLDNRTGGIRQLARVRDGYSRIQQQLVFSRGSKMVCEQQVVTARGPVFGELQSEGYLLALDNKTKLAQYRQRVRLSRGRPMAQLWIEIIPLQLLSSATDEEYFACRWEWPDEKTMVRVASGHEMFVHSGERWHTPTLWEIQERQLVTQIYPHGLPFHRRLTARTVDSILHVRGETCQTFQFTLALNWKNPWALAQETSWPVLRSERLSGRPVAARVGQWLRLDSNQVICSRLVPIEEYHPGIQLRFFEGLGAAVRSKLQACRTLDSARLVNPLGEMVYDLYPMDDTIELDFTAQELLHLELVF